MKLKNPVFRRTFVRVLFIILVLSLLAVAIAGTALAADRRCKKVKSKKGVLIVCPYKNNSQSDGPDPSPECGRSPYLWNYEGSHYERNFSAYCYQFNGDPNELTYDGKVCNDTPLIWTGVCNVPPPA